MTRRGQFHGEAALDRPAGAAGDRAAFREVLRQIDPNSWSPALEGDGLSSTVKTPQNT